MMAGIVPVLLYYNTQAVMEVPVDALLVPCAAVVVITLVLYLLPCLAISLIAKTRRWRSSTTEIELSQILAFWAALSWLVFFSLSFCIELDGLCTAFHWRSGVLSASAGVLPYMFLLALLAAILPIFKRNWLTSITSLMNQAFTMLLLMQLAATTYYFARSEFVIKPAVQTVQQSKVLNLASNKPNFPAAKTSSVDRSRAASSRAGRVDSVAPCLDVPHADSSAAAQTIASQGRPDIYYIVLDEMASSAVLARYENYDDAWFCKALEDRGFFVAKSSLSNYPLTRLSISSSLNMMYLDELTSIAGREKSDLTPTAVLLRNNVVGDVLRKHGYKHIHIDSSVPPTNGSDIADRVIHCGFIDQFSDKLLRSTLAALSPQAMAWLRQEERETILKQFAAPARVAEETNGGQNVFVFLHILCPHEPFLFDADGGPVLNEGARCASRWSADTVSAYTAQAKFAQRKTLETVDSILAAARRTGRAPVIILQGDHGTHSSDYVSSANPSSALLQERYGILNAYLVPSGIRDQLSDETQPVNTFRIVLRNLLDLNLPDLEERQIYATYENVFEFKDVTAFAHSQRSSH